MEGEIYLGALKLKAEMELGPEGPQLVDNWGIHPGLLTGHAVRRGEVFAEAYCQLRGLANVGRQFCLASELLKERQRIS